MVQSCNEYSHSHDLFDSHRGGMPEKAKGKKDDDDDDEGSLAQKAKMKADADKVKASTCCSARSALFPDSARRKCISHYSAHDRAHLLLLLLSRSASQAEKVSAPLGPVRRAHGDEGTP